jgi:serine/threonine protein kinase
MRKSFPVELIGLREYHQALSMSKYDSQQWGEGGRFFARVILCSPAPEHPFAYATPLADCDLASALAQRARPLNTALIVASLFEAVQACHRMGIYHGDLKPANVLMYGDNPRLTDFGLAGSSRSWSARLSGSKGYRYFWNVAYSTGLAEAADLWSLGVIIMEVISRERLFSTSEIKRLSEERTTAYDLLCFLRHKKALGLALVVTRDLVPSAIPTMLDALQKLTASANPLEHEEKSVKLATKRKIDSTTATHCDEPVAVKRSKCMRKHARRKAAKQRSAFGS